MARSSLRTYWEKRDFSKTKEPSGDVVEKKASEPLSFVIQKHDATRLHYDFRLELDGVLLSWAVPKGPSLDTKDKRLAMQTEDHPLAYGSFEGTIPEGEYGGGPVIVWDRGTWEPDGDPHEMLAKGRLRFTMHGEKINGKFHLVKTSDPKARNSWLLMKSKDEFAQEGMTVEKMSDRSVLSGKTIEEIANNVSVPAVIEPQLATPVDAPPTGELWIHEPKIDGYRILARKDADDVHLFTRSGLDWTDAFPDVAEAVRDLPVDNAMIDGEVAVVDEHGAASFQALQEAISDESSDSDVVFFAFDLLFVNGVDLRDLPLIERKQVLEELVADRSDIIELVRHDDGDPHEFLARMQKEGLEGIVSKRADAPYVSARTRDWLKIRLATHEEFVVVGFTPLKNGVKGAIGALLVAAETGAGLEFRGKVGTGYRDKDRVELWKLLEPLKREESPITPRPKVAGIRGVTWVEPLVVVEIKSKETTRDGHLRHPVYMGIRRDKTKEAPALSSAASAEDSAGGSAGDNAGGDAGDNVVAGVTITSPERVVYKIRSHEVTKLDVARYIEAVSPLMLPHVKGRPLAVVRCPDGSFGQCFFQKHVMKGMPKQIHHVDIEDSEGIKHNLVAHDVGGLVGLVQMGVLEFHIWGSREDDHETPDRIVMDLDPAAGLPWKRVVEAAREVRARLAADGLDSFVKTTGGKGLHVVVPLTGTLTWEDVRDYTRGLAEAMERDNPKLYTANMRKASRENRVFIDHLRNGRGATAVAPFSMRAKDGAVAVPVAWDELPDIRGNTWTVLSLHERLSTTKDPWKAYFDMKQTLPGHRSRAEKFG